MAPRRRSNPPPLESKALSAADIDRGIEKLTLRIEDLRRMGANPPPWHDASVGNLEFKIQSAIRDIFGERSHEYQQFGAFPIAALATTVDDDPQENFEAGIQQTITRLEGLIDVLNEKRAELGVDPVQRSRAALNGRSLHPQIAAVVEKLYADGSYAEAVFAATKALIGLVKEKARHPRGRDGRALDNAPLMEQVFSPSKLPAQPPILAVNSLKTDIDLDEQRGFMFLMTGMVSSFRNPGGHGFPTYSPEPALDIISFLSVLADRVESAEYKL